MTIQPTSMAAASRSAAVSPSQGSGVMLARQPTLRGPGGTLAAQPMGSAPFGGGPQGMTPLEVTRTNIAVLEQQAERPNQELAMELRRRAATGYGGGTASPPKGINRHA